MGPGYCSPPSVSGTSTWFNTFMSFIGGNGSVPDVYTLHELNAGVDPLGLPNVLQLSSAPVYINEHGATGEQTPHIPPGLSHVLLTRRVLQLDLLADTLVKSGTSYSPNGVWRMYSYYANMTGTRVAMRASAEGGFDVFAITRGSISRKC